jgi:hypothetical protein
MREPQMCNVVDRVTLDAKSAKEFKEKINDEYRVNMYGINSYQVYICFVCLICFEVAFC